MPTATRTKDAIALLKEDHKNVKAIFDQFEKAKDEDKKHALVEQALKELEVHTAIEEEIFYPEARQALGEEEEDLMDEASEEHRVAKTLVLDLKENHKSDDRFEAKFTVLAENIRHHIEEEEGDLFKKVRETELDLKEIGEKLAARKEELMADESTLEEATESSEIKPYQELG
jgi:hemerythrin superfamily protein